MGLWDQLVVTWDDTERYQPNSHGLVEANSNGTSKSSRLPPDQHYFWDNIYNNPTTRNNIYWVYNLRYTNNPQQPVTEWHKESLGWQGRIDTNTQTRTYTATLGNYGHDENGNKQASSGTAGLLADRYQPETEIWIAIQLDQDRFGQDYQLYSNPTPIFLPAEMTPTQQQDTIQATFTNTYNQPISHHQYRIGHQETGRQTSFSPWITICDPDLQENTRGSNTQITATIQHTQPHPTNNCGGDPQHPLQPGTSYQIQLRATDQTRNQNPHVRNYTHPNKITYNTPPTTPPPTAPPSTTPTTQPTVTTPPPATNPTTPTTQPTPTIIIGTPTTNPPGGTTPQPPEPPSGSPPPAVPTGSNPPEPNDTGPLTTITFTDTSGSVHQTNIGQLATMGVTRGCNPPDNTRFCPNRAVTRGEMATFLVRAFELPPTDDDPFTDTAGNVHRTNINRMATAKISRGCNPPTNTRFCPNRAVTRAEMATFMTRVLQLQDEGNTEFDDTAGNVHATNIRRFAEAGITRGCNPPQNTRYCPDRAVTRGDMATFLIRSTTLNNG